MRKTILGSPIRIMMCSEWFPEVVQTAEASKAVFRKVSLYSFKARNLCCFGQWITWGWMLTVMLNFFTGFGSCTVPTRHSMRLSWFAMFNISDIRGKLLRLDIADARIWSSGLDATHRIEEWRNHHNKSMAPENKWPNQSKLEIKHHSISWQFLIKVHLIKVFKDSPLTKNISN